MTSLSSSLLATAAAAKDCFASNSVLWGAPIQNRNENLAAIFKCILRPFVDSKAPRIRTLSSIAHQTLLLFLYLKGKPAESGFPSWAPAAFFREGTKPLTPEMFSAILFELNLRLICRKKI